jgi:hypothetical protein
VGSGTVNAPARARGLSQVKSGCRITIGSPIFPALKKTLSGTVALQTALPQTACASAACSCVWSAPASPKRTGADNAHTESGAQMPSQNTLPHCPVFFIYLKLPSRCSGWPCSGWRPRRPRRPRPPASGRRRPDGAAGAPDPSAAIARWGCRARRRWGSHSALLARVSSSCALHTDLQLPSAVGGG